MIYIDSDGVMYDFESWKNNLDPNAKSCKEVDRLMVENYKTVFATDDKCKNAEAFLSVIRKNKNAKVLTALPNSKRLMSEFPEVADLLERIEVMRENKYRWFERNGVPRDKVIITSSSSEKTRYCGNCTDVLFDDYDRNVNQWRECGGIGILVG